MATNNATILKLNSSSTNIPTTSYVQLTAATPIPSSQIVICNNTSSTIILGQGASGAEVGFVAVLPNSMLSLNLSLNAIPVGARLALEAADATASTGYVTVSLIP